MLKFDQFQRPQRYIGNEINVVKKEHKGRIPICISYPDMYDIGMSNLGLRIIYGLMNEDDDAVCERVFMPGVDMAAYLRENNIPLFSLESKTPLNQFEVIGFSFAYELNFTNFLHILDLGKIPLLSRERDKQIVIAGGIPNPEPLADFVDVFFIGEFEDSAELFLKVLHDNKSKKERLEALAKIEGFYIPSLHIDTQIKRAYVKDLDRTYFPFKWLTPHTQIVHDRIPIEVARGCPHGCTFCQARAIYNPYRERGIERIVELIEKSYVSSGYENYSLLSLSTSSYTGIGELLDRISPYLRERKIGLSVPSLRIDDIIGPLYEKLSLIKKTSLTVAVEAANDTLRNTLNKRIDIQKLFTAAGELRRFGIKHIKLYFMYGFPGETEDDLRAIGPFIQDLNRASKMDIHASINIFVPKPFSAWGNRKMDDYKTITAKRDLIMANIPKWRSIKVDTSIPERSILEGICSRGDRQVGKAILKAFENGAMLDGYSEYFKWEIWEKAFANTHIDYNKYLLETTQPPWGFIK